MDFDFSDDQEQLRDAVRKWVDKGYTFERRRAAVAAGGFDRGIRQKQTRRPFWRRAFVTFGSDQLHKKSDPVTCVASLIPVNTRWKFAVPSPSVSINSRSVALSKRASELFDPPVKAASPR